MSMLPSLSVWSSVKFPFPAYSHEKKTALKCSAESCDNFIRRNYEERRAKRSSALINLTVPNSLNVDKENSVPNLYCECPPKPKTLPVTKKKSRHIRFVTLPEIILYEKESAISMERLSDHQNLEPCESDLIPQDDEYKSEGPKENDEIGSIPFVKPWTLEELVEINRQKEEAKNKMRLRNGKRKENMKSNDRAMETLKGLIHSNEKCIQKEILSSPFSNCIY